MDASPGRLVRAALLVATVATSAAALEVPYLGSRVNDLAELIAADTESRIEADLASFEERTGSQIAVLTVPSLEGEALESFTQRVAETWGLGRAEVDDGVLFFVSRDDRKMRIEVGYGLEGNLTDLQSSRILNEIVRPRFRTGDFGAGVEAGVAAIITTVEGGEALPPPADPASRGEAPWPVIFFFSFFTLAGAGRLGWVFAPLLAVAWYTVVHGAFGAPFGLVAATVWLGVFILLRLIGARFGGIGRGTGWSSRSGHWGGWGGGGSGGGFSGGGFSGGGGSFGGGGSSSGW